MKDLHAMIPERTNPTALDRAAGRTRQRGVSLIELMIALLLSSLIILAMVSVFIAGRASFLTQEQVARQQENGRFAWELITGELQEAGYHPVVWDPPALGFALTNNTTDGGGLNPDTLELQYESDRNCFGAENTVTEAVTQPNGTNVNVPQYYQKLARFAVDGTTDQLVYTCSYGPVNGALVQQINAPVADGIENLQIQYGEDTTGDLSVNQWVNAGAWTNFFDVVSVRIAVVVATPEEFTVEDDTQTFDLYSGTSTAAGDNRARKVFAGQVNLRNLTL